MFDLTKRASSGMATHYCVVFYNRVSKSFKAYEARDPFRCRDSVTKNHSENMVFAAIIPQSSEQAAIEWKFAFEKNMQAFSNLIRTVADWYPGILSEQYDPHTKIANQSPGNRQLTTSDVPTTDADK